MSNSLCQRPEHFADGQGWVRSVIVKLLRVARLHPLARKINIARVDFLRYIDALGLARGASAFFRFKLAKPGSLVRARIPGSKTPLQIRAGTEDAIVFQQVFFERQYDLDLALQPKLIIDGGAHVGCATRFFASKYPDAIVVAIEPESTNFRLLKGNVDGCPNVLPIRAALWGTPTVLNIVDPHSASWAFRMEESNGEGIATTLGLTVDELLAWSASSSIDILKLDVEGAEREIFSSDCTHWMGAVSAMIIELHDRFVAGCREALERATAGFEFTESVSGECLVLQRKEQGRTAAGAVRSGPPACVCPASGSLQRGRSSTMIENGQRIGKKQYYAGHRGRRWCRLL